MKAEERPQRVQRFGPEPWEEIAGLTWSLWDLWFCVVAVLDHDGDLEALADTFVEALRSHRLSDRNASEAKLSHLTDLVLRLDDCGLHPADLADADVLADQRIVKRAREKVNGRVGLEWRACTPAMIDTPQSKGRVGSEQGTESENSHPPVPGTPRRFSRDDRRIKNREWASWRSNR